MPRPSPMTPRHTTFKGNFDLQALKLYQDKGPEQVAFIPSHHYLRSGGGQPVWPAGVRRLPTAAGSGLFDAARFAENAWFIQRREEVMPKSHSEIVREMFSYADGAMAPRRTLVNISALSPPGQML